MAAVCCDFIVADILVLDKVEPKRENEHIEEIHDLGMDPFEVPSPPFLIIPVSLSPFSTFQPHASLVPHALD